jgi:small subunit ribosomal protein S1
VKGDILLLQDNTFADEQREGLDTFDFQELLDEYDYAPPHQGQILDSTILEARDNELILDVGLKRDAVVPRTDLDRIDDELRDSLKAGDELKVWVLRPYDRDGDLIVSINKALELEDWDRAHKLLDSGETVECEVIGRNRGGLLVAFGRLRAFVPNSHVTSIPRGTSADRRDEAKRALQGERLRVKVIEIDRQRNRLVMSEREAREAERQDRLAELEAGQDIEGRVVNLVDFGAFVDLGGVDGLLHVSRIAHHRVEHPGDVFTVGDKVTVRVIDVDRKRERISLDRRPLIPNPWETFIEEHHPGDLLTGVVTGIVDYGIFVKVEEGVQGLVHISSMSTLGIKHPEEMFRENDEVLVRIAEIDPDRERLDLSVDAVTYDEQQAWLYQRHEAGDDAAEAPVAEAVVEDAAELEPVAEESESEAPSAEAESSDVPAEESDDQPATA